VSTQSINADVLKSASFAQGENMTADMISVSQCAALSGLAADEMILGVTPSKLHEQLFERYILDCEGGHNRLRDRIVRDIRSCIGLGAKKRAADLLIVLRHALAQRIQAARGASLRPRAKRATSSRTTLGANNGIRGRAMGAFRIISSRMIASDSGVAEDNVFCFEAYRRKFRLTSASPA
jgi:hypothetical protein